jgi:hypothetical protein
MSDPTWSTRALPQAEEAIIYVQDAGTAGAPTSADELAFVTDFSVESAADRTEKGPWINYNRKKTVRAGTTFSGTFTIDWSKAADAVRAKVVAAAFTGSRLKITAEIYASGDKFVADQVDVDGSISLSASDGTTGEFSLAMDLVTHTPQAAS